MVCKIKFPSLNSANMLYIGKDLFFVLWQGILWLILQNHLPLYPSTALISYFLARCLKLEWFWIASLKAQIILLYKLQATRTEAVSSSFCGNMVGEFKNQNFDFPIFCIEQRKKKINPLTIKSRDSKRIQLDLVVHEMWV